MNFKKTKASLPLILSSIIASSNSFAIENNKDLKLELPPKISSLNEIKIPDFQSKYNLSHPYNQEINDFSDLLKINEKEINPRTLYHRCFDLCFEISIGKQPFKIYYKF